MELKSLIALAISVLPGCHLTQAISGGLHILTSGVPIDRAMVEDENPGIRRLLYEVRAVKRWGAEHGLVPTQSYETYVDVERPAVVWVVAGCEPLSFSPKVWTFPIVGSFTYRAWFDRRRAEEDVREIEAEGLDAWVRGTMAYSTLGFFDDPVLSTMLSPGEPEAAGDLANVILHESLHATKYIDSQSFFNESLASFVADTLTPQYLGDTYGPKSLELRSWLEIESLRRTRVELLSAAFQELSHVYESARTDEEKRAEKAAVFDRLERKLGRRFNNAALLQMQTYDSGRASFERALERCGSFRSFASMIRRVGPGDFRHAHDDDIAAVLSRVASVCGDREIDTSPG